MVEVYKILYVDYVLNKSLEIQTNRDWYTFAVYCCKVTLESMFFCLLRRCTTRQWLFKIVPPLLIVYRRSCANFLLKLNTWKLRKNSIKWTFRAEYKIFLGWCIVKYKWIFGVYTPILQLVQKLINHFCDIPILSESFDKFLWEALSLFCLSELEHTLIKS